MWWGHHALKFRKKTKKSLKSIAIGVNYCLKWSIYYNGDARFEEPFFLAEGLVLAVARGEQI